MSHWQPLRFRYKIVLMTSRMAIARGRPPRSLRGAGISGSKLAHCSSVKSDGYDFLCCWSHDMLAPSLALTRSTPAFYHISSQNQFPESLLQHESPSIGCSFGQTRLSCLIVGSMQSREKMTLPLVYCIHASTKYGAWRNAHGTV